MPEFPPFLKHPTNRVATTSHAVPGFESFVFDGVDGSQMEVRVCTETSISPQRSQGFDEYLVVVEGNYTLLIQGRSVELRAGQEYLIPRGVSHGSKVLEGTRSLHAFSGRRHGRADPGA